MLRLCGFISLVGLSLTDQVAQAQTMQLFTSSDDYEITTVFSDVSDFDFSITIDAPLAVGVYENPPIIEVSYRVAGILVAGTPSEFPAFELERIITGEEFYAQGSSLQFEIDETAVLEDGIQIAELSGSEVLFSFNGREIDNGRFHPALFELSADGTGGIQNSNNIPTLDPLLEVDFGSEYISSLVFDTGNTTLIVATGEGNSSDGRDEDNSSGGGVFGLIEWLMLLCVALCTGFKRLVKSNGASSCSK